MRARTLLIHHAKEDGMVRWGHITDASVSLVLVAYSGACTPSSTAWTRTEDVRPTTTRFVWIVDQSLSTEHTDAARDRFAALDDAFASITRDPRAAIAAVAYSDTARVSGFTRDGAALFDTLRPDLVGRDSNLGLALSAARSLIGSDIEARPQEPTRYAVWIITDGFPTTPAGDAKPGDRGNRDDAGATLAAEVRALRALTAEHPQLDLHVHVRLAGESLAPALERHFELDLTASRALYADLAELGAGTFRHVANQDVTR